MSDDHPARHAVYRMLDESYLHAAIGYAAFPHLLAPNRRITNIGAVARREIEI
jgi:hypothetical protein